MGFSRSDARGAIPTSIFAYLFLPFAHANYIGNCWFNSFSTADKQDVPYGLRRHIYIYIMTIVLQNADLLYIKYESQESIEIKSTYLTIGWRQREGMSNTAEIKWEMRYIYIYATNSIPRTTTKPREIPSTKGP